MSNLLKQVTFDRLNRKKDKSVSMTFITQLEQSSEELMEMDKLLNDMGVLFFKTSGKITDKEIEALEVSKIEKEGKTQSQKIRNKIWVLWNKGESKLTEKEFYHFKTERILEYLQKEIDLLD